QLNLQHDWLAVTLADFRRRIDVGRQMNMMAFTFNQPLLFDRSQKPISRSVVKNFRRGSGGVPQLDLDRMTLTGSDPKAVLAERKSFLIIASDDILKLFECEFNPVLARRFDQLLNRRPAGLVEAETDLLGLMPQH